MYLYIFFYPRNREWVTWLNQRASYQIALRLLMSLPYSFHPSVLFPCISLVCLSSHPFSPLPPFHPPLIISPHPQSRSRHNGAVVWWFWKELMETTSLPSSRSCAHACARAHARAPLWMSSITVLDLLHLLNSTHLFISCNILQAKGGHFLWNEDILSGPQNFKDMFVGVLVCKLELVGIGFI